MRQARALGNTLVKDFDDLSRRRHNLYSAACRAKFMEELSNFVNAEDVRILTCGLSTVNSDSALQASDSIRDALSLASEAGDVETAGEDVCNGRAPQGALKISYGSISPLIIPGHVSSYLICFDCFSSLTAKSHSTEQLL